MVMSSDGTKHSDNGHSALPTPVPLATGSAVTPKFNFSVGHNTAPITSKGQSNNFTASEIGLQFGNGMLAGLKVLNAPEDLNANPSGQVGYVPYLGYSFDATKDVEVTLKLGAQIHTPGATASNPLYAQVTMSGNPGWEPLFHQVSVYTDLQNRSLQYDNHLLLTGDAKGLRLNATSGTSHKWDGNGGYWPQIWLGAGIVGGFDAFGQGTELKASYLFGIDGKSPSALLVGTTWRPNK